MKTISELNERWWYRLLKVVYMSICLIVTISIITLIYTDNPPKFNVLESSIQCLDGREFMLGAYPNLYSEYLSSEDRNNFQTWCTTEQTGVENGRAVIKKLDNYGTPITQYEFKPNYLPRDWGNIIWGTFLTIVGAYVITRIIQCTFYYVVLGSMHPRKRKYESDTLLP